jgi:proteasome lid subunit RPN8/RPN11
MMAAGSDEAGRADSVEESRSVHRFAPLPLSPARGHLVVPESVAIATISALQGFGGPDGPHEGIAFWAGREVGDDQIVASVVVPRADHGRQSVYVSADQVGEVAHQARLRRLVVLAQVHSHPGLDTRHSDADDSLILMAREGMFSLVVARYGEGGITPELGAGVHQFQDGQWIQVSDAERSLIVVPTKLRL